MENCCPLELKFKLQREKPTHLESPPSAAITWFCNWHHSKPIWSMTCVLRINFQPFLIYLWFNSRILLQKHIQISHHINEKKYAQNEATKKYLHREKFHPNSISIWIYFHLKKCIQVKKGKTARFMDTLRLRFPKKKLN